MTQNFNSFAAMVTALPTDMACREYLESKRWNGTPVCPHCGVMDANHYKLKVKGEFKGMYKCRACKERFTVTLGTMFEGSPIPLRKWFIACYIFSSHKKGISSHQLARDLGVTQKTAWFMLHRLRETFGSNDKGGERMGGEGVVVESDSTIIGGKVKNMSNAKRHAIKEGEASQNDNKTNVVAFLERGGNLRLEIVKKDVQVKEYVAGTVETDSALMTDKGTEYEGIGKEYAFHGVVDHSKSEYVKDKVIHVNTLEGAFSLFDRMVLGIYHSITPKHLQAYLDEHAFRYNSRKAGDKTRFDAALIRTNGVRLKYKDLIAE